LATSGDTYGVPHGIRIYKNPTGMARAYGFAPLCGHAALVADCSFGTDRFCTAGAGIPRTPGAVTNASPGWLRAGDRCREPVSNGLLPRRP